MSLNAAPSLHYVSPLLLFLVSVCASKRNSPFTLRPTQMSHRGDDTVLYLHTSCLALCENTKRDQSFNFKYVLFSKIKLKVKKK